MTGGGGCAAGKPGNQKRKKKKKKAQLTAEQILASAYVREWAFRGCSSPAQKLASDGFELAAPAAAPPTTKKRSGDRVIFELHAHSTCSDGFLSPTALVESAHIKGVKVLALTDHDTMAGVPEAVEAASKFNIKIIPGVEISAVYLSEDDVEADEPVHLLAYYGGCGPANFEELENLLASIRNGRYIRAKQMLSKLSELKMPLKWEHVAKIAGSGVAPGRLHVARAMVEAGYVENLKQAFKKYLHDGGPAYATGDEPSAVNVVKLISRTGGIAALAHPWALKHPNAVIRSLKAAGLHALEVYKSDGHVFGFSDLADTYNLLKLGGSDFHGRGAQEESDLGSVVLPVTAIYKFLNLAQPIWFCALKEILSSFAEEPTDSNLEKFFRYRKCSELRGHLNADYYKDTLNLYISSWLTKEEKETADLEAIRLKLSNTVITKDGLPVSVTRR